jgi:hypothetical protein
MGAPLPKTEFQSPSENTQIRTGINSTVRRHRALPCIFGRNSGADQTDQQDIVRPLSLSPYFRTKTDGQGVLATDEGERLCVGHAVRIQAYRGRGFRLRNIPAEQVRTHVRWGNYEGPPHYDVPLADIVDIKFAGRPASISFEAANPRHAHE